MDILNFLILWLGILPAFHVNCKPRYKTLVISFDGFAAHYLQNGKIGKYPGFRKIMESGVFSESFQNVFPGETFPNHFTMVTGLYPESHGMVSNLFHDPELHRDFESPFYGKPNRTDLEDPVWWDAEPMWLTAHRLGFANIATSMWPGDRVVYQPVNKTANRLHVEYNGNVPFKERIDDVLDCLANEDIDLVLMFNFEPDDTGHITGVTGVAIEHVIAMLDDQMTYLLEGIKRVGLEGRLNLLLCSDHSMGPITRQYDISDYIDLNETLLHHVPRIGARADIWPRLGCEEFVITKLKEAANKSQGAFVVFNKEQLPAYFHYSKNRRIAPLMVLGMQGTCINSNEEVEAEKFGYRAIHGWDPTLTGQQPIFIALGPSFKSGGYNATLTTLGMSTKDVYAILARLLEVEMTELPPNNSSSSLISDLFK